MPLPPFDLMSGPPSAKASSSKTSNSKGSGVSQASLFDLKGLVSEHKSTFSKEGKNPVKGEALLRRGNIGELVSARLTPISLGMNLMCVRFCGLVEGQILPSITESPQAYGTASSEGSKAGSNIR